MRQIRKGRSTSLLLMFVAAWIAGTAASAAHAGAKLKQWQTISNERYGFEIAYPGSVFTERQGTPSLDGQVLISHDGGARLLVGAFPNDSDATLAEYRAQILSESYQGAEIDYAPMKKRFFVLSGTRGDTHFYERVSFTCDGRLINSWALLYPVSERHIYDPIVEAIAPTYSPGAGRTGQCD
ncbi:hypothetical protein [Hyphomicrobium sp.]|uniref:hypothetical protein n=1 Tax=Hyphomicrobium sp. TaxID=82 RepID=UPI002E342C45|nr:hypothetical protein [Hyphomicrobium sp.]HEX2841619.1 hypothetical protein [Hyphomicrobium sp.]